MEVRVLEAIYEAVDEINEQLPAAQWLAKDPDMVLFGPGGRLDSLGLVNFIAEVEARLEDNFDTVITLADEKALSQKRSPFHTIGSLSEYVGSLLDARVHG